MTGYTKQQTNFTLFYETHIDDILQSDYLQIDEVPWRIADRPGQSCRHGYAWQSVQTDGYKVYDYFESLPGIVLLTCMAHIRRKFIEAQKSHPSQAAKALEYIATL